MYLYHIVSGLKLLLGLGLLLIVYNFINVYEDPVIGIGLGFLGLFIACRGLSFFLFFGVQRLWRHVAKNRIIKDSYKLSLLFGVYAMINVLLLLLGNWTKLIGLLLLIAFVVLQVVLFSNERKEIKTL